MSAIGNAAIVGVAACGLLALLVARARSRATRAPTWERTMGTVLSSTVQVGNNGHGRAEAPLVLYAFQVGDQVFQGHRVRAEGACGAASEVVARYPAGANVVVYYDPAHPDHSALEL